MTKKLSLEEIENIQNEILGKPSDPNLKSIKAETKEIEISETETDTETETETESNSSKRKRGRPKSKIPHKQKLINDYVKLKHELGEEIKESHTELKRMKISILERKLGELIDKTAKDKLLNNLDQETKEELKEENADAKTRTAVNALYNMNVLALLVTEKLTKQYEEDIGVSLEGWVEDVNKEKQQLKDILQAIYEEHAESIDQYVSPISVWAMFMMQSGMGVITKNIEEKKKNSCDQLAEQQDLL